MSRIFVEETLSKIGQKVELAGWVERRRDMGKIIFVDLRDRSSLLQIVFLSRDKKLFELASSLRSEFVVKITGEVKERDPKTVNSKLTTGKIELLAESLEILNPSKTPPFELDKDTHEINEELRLKYRYLDLRTERLQRNLVLRSQFVQAAREFLFKNNFTEIETPLLSKATPEGSRDFVVPSRLQPGKFYALPQSPQQYKQLLMVAGFERYFQIARALRDEDLRADRGFEHSQIDLEMSFVERADIMNLVEVMMISVAESLGCKIKQKPFPRFTYAEAMKKFGADKFDMRQEQEKKDGILAYAWVIDFPFFERNDEGGWTFTHNPFSMPLPEYLEDHLSGRNIEKILTSQYDLVCNGFEVGGGSIRAHTSEVLRATYKIMGYSEEEIQNSVGHMLEALEYGAPPHGGIALGIERNLMILTGEQYLREVQAFPTTSGGRTAVMDAPSELPEKTMRELHIRPVK